MRLPWVSRELHSFALQQVERQAEQIAQLHAARREQWERYDTLLYKYHDLKLAGGATVPVTALPAAKEPDVVTKAIIEKAGNNRRLRKQFTEYVAEQRALQVPEDTIAAAIYAGITDDGGVPG